MLDFSISADFPGIFIIIKNFSLFRRWTSLSTQIIKMSVEEIPQGAAVQVISKNEKKAREAIIKLGLVQIKDISRVTFRKKDNSIIAIETPEVYKTPGGAYVVFGEAKVEDLTQRYQEAMAAQQAAQQASSLVNKEGAPSDLAASIQDDLAKASLEDKADDAEEGDVDATGLEESDIAVVIEQSNVSRAKAVKALKENNGDVVNAIMSLAWFFI